MDSNVLPEFSQLVQRASRATFPMGTPVPLSDEQRQALVSLVDFVREYDGLILQGLENMIAT